MANRGVAAAATGLATLVTNPGSINFGQKPVFPLKTPNFHSQYCSRTITTEITRNSRWDSNAETGRSQKFKFKFRDKNKRYRDNDIVDEEEEEEEEEEESSGMGMGKKRRWWSDKPPYMEEEKAPGILEEFLDSLWILKLSKFYGWTLPPMIISSLIATGPKAFLMTLSLTIGLSVLSFMFKKLMGTTLSKPRLRARKRRRKPFVSYPGNVGTYNREEEGRQGETVKGNGMPRSWVVNNDSSVKKDKQDAPSFGGWDELDAMEYIARRPPPPPREADQNRRKPSTDRKLGRRGESDAPLLLRLIIAIFPFLASWTKML